ncbi:Hypothetical predicted protein [Cloeon dipterum]|uniref:Uncharacterized protein n=1 Tax=Cloeon dipterum TaxID=197152 RepID=A0A8S1CPY4_9INSE|nr:Hypothetical predicted protein [Cloeon dipterum]
MVLEGRIAREEASVVDGLQFLKDVSAGQHIHFGRKSSFAKSASEKRSAPKHAKNQPSTKQSNLLNQTRPNWANSDDTALDSTWVDANECTGKSVGVDTLLRVHLNGQVHSRADVRRQFLAIDKQRVRKGAGFQ